MESLLANYGSDDEDDEGPQETPPRTRAPLFASLPPPKLSGEDPAPRSSLFASLPRPKFAGADTWKPDFRVSNERIRNSNEEEKASETPLLAAHRDAGDAFNHREAKANPKVSDNAFRVSGLHTKASDDTHRKDVELNAGDANGTSKSKRVSLFGALPPPKNTGSSLVPLQSQPLPAPSSKRVVQIRPNINMALLKDLDDDDDAQPQAKRHATEVVGSSKATGLAAILPKPKNVGTTLGSGYASGHHATLDIGASINVVPSLSRVINSELAPQSMHDPSSFANEHSFETDNSYEHLGGSHVSASSEAWEGYNQDTHADFPTHVDAVQFDAPSYQSDLLSLEGAEVLCPEGYYSVPEGYSEGMPAHETSSSTASTAQDPIANMLLKERRKGGKNEPLNIIEVKQTDLTATKLREDQLRITGIAFGPAYQPISSNKAKPSKLHRRKHQIGSLYYDMKQKEMELLERRAKGHMTKAETQAKYGW